MRIGSKISHILIIFDVNHHLWASALLGVSYFSLLPASCTYTLFRKGFNHFRKPRKKLYITPWCKHTINLSTHLFGKYLSMSIYSIRSWDILMNNPHSITSWSLWYTRERKPSGVYRLTWKEKQAFNYNSGCFSGNRQVSTSPEIDKLLWEWPKEDQPW